MQGAQRILLLDDDEDLLDVYSEMLRQLPSKPEVHTASSGARALALLEAQPFKLLLSDLNLPKMDGLQVLSIVRRKFPNLRTAVLTSLDDEQFRTRAYGMGIDLYIEKPSNEHEIKFFVECVESLLGQNEREGFRGLQSKTLVDLIQLECLSQSSSLLKVVNGASNGQIWFDKGNVIDAELQDLGGQEAFQKILSWRTGSFEILPPEPNRARAIFTSHQGLLLEIAQAQDEAGGAQKSQETDEGKAPQTGSENWLNDCAKISGLDFAHIRDKTSGKNMASWGSENPEPIGRWAVDTFQTMSDLGDVLQAGELANIESTSLHHHTIVGQKGNVVICAGFRKLTDKKIAHQSWERIAESWVSSI